ncbi:DNA topoisomerase IV subunit A [Candidatus Nanopelagicales bacterium]|nr:DNA topoisomerase IV subunit A [Candidatus Nanopelagicales bacterium]
MTRAKADAAPPSEPEERIIDVDINEEMRGSFLEYAYSVIYSRALPDARDGLKPVQRRILFQMAQMGLRPDRGHVKSARVVGEVMGRLHPHGDGAIYDALVRMSQPFSLRLPMIDGHGNFGSADDGPAAMRYTECRLAPPALEMTASIDEDTVDFRPNYDSRETEPVVLPAALPNLLVNGAAGIAVGMATNMAPHNLTEVVAAARHLLEYPNARLDTLMRFVPGPDLPTGGMIVGLEGVKEAYETGRGRFRIRAKTSIEKVSARRQGIVVTELPYGVGPERVSERIKDLVLSKKLTGIANLVDLTDAEHGLRLVIEVKSGFNPQALRERLFKLTPLEEQFSVNNVALVDGTPKTLGLRALLSEYIGHRLEVVKRRSKYRLARAEERLHLVAGLLIAILDIDDVIAIVRGSDDAAQAKKRLIAAFDLSETQATYILEMPLRRLTKFSKLELEAEADELRDRIAALKEILGSKAALKKVVSTELAQVADKHGTPRRTVLLQSDGVVSPDVPLQVEDAQCWVLLSSTGLLARTSTAELPEGLDPNAPHGCIDSGAPTTSRGDVGVVGSDGIVRRISVVELPELPASESASVAGGTPLGALADLPKGVSAVGLVPISAVKGEDAEQPSGADSDGVADQSTGHTVALGTRSGVVKRVNPDGPASKDSWELIRLAPGDSVISAGQCARGDDLVFITAQAQLLRFSADVVRVQGRGGGGMAGIKLRPDDTAIHFAVVNPQDANEVVTVSGSDGELPGLGAATVKRTGYQDFPSKGRATGGVRCHRFRKGEDHLELARAGGNPQAAATTRGKPVKLPPELGGRDGTGTPLTQIIGALGGRPR